MTNEFFVGEPIDKFANADQATRDRVRVELLGS
jgi:hypothetical protein